MTREISTILALVGVLAACGSRSAPVAEPARQTAPSNRTETEADTASPSPGIAPPSTTPTASRSPAGVRKSRIPVAAQRPDPAASGLYRFNTDGTTQVSDGPKRRLPEVTTQEIHPAESRRQRSIRDLRDDDGTGSTTEQLLEYDDEGVRLLEFHIRSNFAGVARQYSFMLPSKPIVLRANAAPGDSTDIRMSGDGVTIDLEVTVIGTERVGIDGQTRDTLVVRFFSTLSGELEGTQRSINNIDPEASLTLREDVNSDVRQGAIRVRADYSAALVSLRPS